MNESDHVVIVGAGLGAQSTIDRLRRDGFTGALTLIGEESHPPYDRPPLSKEQLWSENDAGPRLLGADGSLKDLGVSFLPKTRATGLDVDRKLVDTDEGPVHYSHLVIATGASARRLDPSAHELAGVHTIRTFDDTLALRPQLRPGRRLVVVGGGFIGCEVAGAAAEAGLDVVLVDALPVPLGRSLGTATGEYVAALHRAAGVKLETGVGVSAIVGDGSTVTAVRLDDDREIAADIVLVALGARPAVGWLRNSRLQLNTGITTDEHCSTSARDVYAIGDVAESYSPRENRHMVVEHWMNAREQGTVAASRILGNTPSGPAALPYFWSEQVDCRIQALGTPDPTAPTVVLEWNEPKPGAIVLYGSADRVDAAVGFNAAGRLMRLRGLLQRHAARKEFEESVLGS